MSSEGAGGYLGEWVGGRNLLEILPATPSKVEGFMLKPYAQYGGRKWGVFDGQYRVGMLALDDYGDPPHERWDAEVASHMVRQAGTGSGDDPASAARIALAAFRTVWEKSACCRLWQLGYGISTGYVTSGPLSSELKCDFVMWFRKPDPKAGGDCGVLELSHDGEEWTATVVADGVGPMEGSVHSNRMVAVEVALHRWADEINEFRENVRREQAQDG